MERLRSYYWSSYLQYIGRRKRLDFVTYAPTLALMEGAAADRGRRYRPFAARYLTRYAGLTQRGVAGILGVSTGVAVSLQLRRFEELVAENPKLCAQARKCDRALALLMKTHARR